jgi:hypothetical protein
MSGERPDFIPKQPSLPEQVQPFQGRAEGKQSLQGPTTVDPFEKARKAHEKTMKEYYNGMSVVMFFSSIPLLAAVAVDLMPNSWFNIKDKKVVSEPPRIEINEQGRELHPSPVPGFPCP